MSTILLVGSTGPLGQAIGRELTVRGHTVHGVSRSGGLGTAVLDATNTKALRALLRDLKPDSVIDLSRPDLSSGDAASAEVDGAVAAHHRFLSTCGDEGIARMVFASSAAVYGTASRQPHVESEALPPGGPYARVKSGSERNLSDASALGAFAELALSLRIFNVYGPGFSQSLITRLVEHTEPAPAVYVSGDFVRDYIHSTDVARSVAGAIEGPPLGAHVLNLGTGVGTSNSEVVAALPDAVYVGRHDLATPSYSVADMTLARQTLGLPAFLRVADAVERWRGAES
ncbi:MAG: NAD-dependent epimerase/dehydratase family protein [Demequinaceae bacterium]|nr:NAD-dependent epimerase/dehydratase family protein [Demequinaceae bacterium]